MPQDQLLAETTPNANSWQKEEKRNRDLRIQSVHQLAIVSLLLEEAQFKGDHDVHKSRQDHAFIWTNNLAIHLRIYTH